MHEAYAVGFDFGNGGEDIGGDEVGAARFRRERESLLRPRHGCGYGGVRARFRCARCGRTTGAGWELGRRYRSEVGNEPGKRVGEREEEDVEHAGEEGEDEDGQEKARVAQICVEGHSPCTLR